MSSNPQSPSQSWVIGSAPDCTVVVAQPAVSGHHCRLTRQGDRFWIEDLQSTNGTWVNGAPIAVGQPVSIQPGAPVTLGRQTPFPWAAIQALAQASVKVPQAPQISQASQAPPPLPGFASGPGVAASSNPAGSSSGRVITIGRAPESMVQIDLPIISWNHAQIVFEGGRAILEDLS